MNDGEEHQLFYPKDVIGKYVIESLISGSSAEHASRNNVYKAFIPETEGKKYYAIKPLPYESKEDIFYFDREESILNQLKDYDTILPHIDSIEQKFIFPGDDDQEETHTTYMCVIMDFCNYLDLRDYYLLDIKPKDQKTKDELIRKVFYKTLTILKTIHNLGIVHHDIKPENFLVKEKNPLTIVLTDFELAIQLNQDETTDSQSGTAKYMAPEVLRGLEHDMASDIWSLGFMMYYMATNKFPFKILKKHEQMDIILENIEKHSLMFSSCVSKNLQDLLRKMLTINQSDRIDADTALQHPYFENYADVEQDTKDVVSGYTDLEREEISAERINQESIEGGN